MGSHLDFGILPQPIAATHKWYQATSSERQGKMEVGASSALTDFFNYRTIVPMSDHIRIGVGSIRLAIWRLWRQTCECQMAIGTGQSIGFERNL